MKRFITVVSVISPEMSAHRLRLTTSLHALAVLLFLTATVFAQYESQGYLPLTTAELGTRFPVTYIGTLGSGRPGYFEEKGDKPLPARLDIGPSGANVKPTSDDDNTIISGTDNRKREWSIQIGACNIAYACRFYEADLDKNGVRDAVVVFPTGGNGLAPTSHILAITFDEAGRPVTFEAEGYFQELDGKIFDLVDLNRNGRAELLYMNFDEGYWITNIYEVKNAKWQRISGRHGKRNYPLYTRFTFRENHNPTAPKKGRHPFAPDLSNTSPRLVGQLVSYEWADLTSGQDLSLMIKDKNGAVVLGKPVSWYSTFMIVLDLPEGRKIVSLSANSDELKSLLDKIVNSHYEVALFGHRRAGSSSPELLWARPSGRHR